MEKKEAEKIAKREAKRAEKEKRGSSLDFFMTPVV